MTHEHSKPTPRLFKGVTALFAGLLFAANALAEPPHGKAHPQGKHGSGAAHSGGTSGSTLVRAGITIDRARQLAVQHQAVGYQGLPPGIRKNLARGKPLPPGIAKKAVPGGVLVGLPQYPGYEWGVAGTDLILIEIASQVIAEVLGGVFR